MLTKTFVPADVRNGHRPFELKSSAQISLEASRLLMGLLQLDPNQRLSAAEALRHPWLQPRITSTAPSRPVGSTRNSERKVRNQKLSKVKGQASVVQAFKAFDQEFCPILSESTRAPSTPAGADESIKELFLDS